MKNKLHYSDGFVHDMDEIWDYIMQAPGNPSAAENTVGRILTAVERLTMFPEMGTLLFPEKHGAEPYRFLVSGNYMIFYRVRGSAIYLDRILHGRRDYPALLFGEPEE